MEVQYSLSTTTIFLIISTLLFLATTLRSIKSSPKRTSLKLPPGPWKLPIIGNLHNFIGSSLPHHTLRDLSRKYGPLMHLQMGEVSALVVSSPSMAREFLKTHDLSFAQRPQVLAGRVAAYNDLDIAFSPYGEYWKQMKKVCVLELLSPKRVEYFSSIRHEEVCDLVESIRSSSSLRSPINLTETLLNLMSTITSRAAFGDKFKFDDGFDLISAVEEGSLLASGFNLADLFPSKKFLESIGQMRAKLEKIHEKVDKILQTLIDNRIKEQTGKESSDESKEEKEDLVLILLKLQQSGTLEIPITIEHVKAVIFDIFIAGTDTASKTMEWAMSEMMKNPVIMEKAQSEIRQVLKGKKKFGEVDIQKLNYLKAVIKETLRLHPPAPLLLPRECREACTIEGYDIPLKTKVIVNAWAIARDPSYWDNAEAFLPERFLNSSVDYKGTNFEYIPFGAGRRICPGMSFGMVGMELTLAQLLYHFNWELPNGMRTEDFDMTEMFGASVGRKTNLCLRAIPFIPVDEE